MEDAVAGVEQDQPHAKIAEAAASILLEEIRKNSDGKSQSGKAEIQEKVFASELVERASVGAPNVIKS